MGCCCSNEEKESGYESARIPTTDAIPYTPDPDEIPVRAYRDNDRTDTRNNNK